MYKISSATKPLLFMLVSVGIYIWATMKWGQCPAIDCSENFIDNWLRTLKTGSVYLMLLSLLFLPLPAKYFNKWLKYVFSWGFPMVVYLTYITTGSSSIPAYGKVEVVKFWGMAFAAITIIFIAVQIYLDHKQKKNK